MRRLALLLCLPLLSCGPSLTGDDDTVSDDDETVGDPEPADLLRPSWTEGQLFHLEVSSRWQPQSSELGWQADSLEAVAAPPLDLDTWTDPLVWRYEVLEAGLEPEIGHRLFELAQQGHRPGTLAVLKVSLEQGLEPQLPLAAAAPVLYLALREDRLRPVALAVLHGPPEARVQRSWVAAPELADRSWSRLAQSRLFGAPHYLPPWPLRLADEQRVLEDGRLLSAAVTGDGVDVVYDDLLDGGPVAQSWAEGEPWASLTVTPSLTARLMSEEEVTELLGVPPAPSEPTDEDATWSDPLVVAPSLDEAARVTDGDAGVNSVSLADDLPWAGSWWRFSEAAMVFGTDAGAGSISWQRREAFGAAATALLAAEDALRSLWRLGEQGSAAWDEAEAERVAARQVFVDELVVFYNALRQGIDAGQVLVADGRITAPAGWHADFEAFDLPLDGLPPLEKHALIAQLNDDMHGSNPWFAVGWELLEHWRPDGSSWWGHHSGWSAASFAAPEPRQPLELAFGSTGQHTISLGVGDQKGLLSESHVWTPGLSFGDRFVGADGEELADLGPAATLTLLRTWIRDHDRPLVLDTAAAEQVWTFPGWAYDVSLEVASSSGSGRVNVNLADADYLAGLPGVDAALADALVERRLAWGPYQSDDELLAVAGFDDELLAELASLITLDSDGDHTDWGLVLTVRFSTSGVGYEHVDTDPDQPMGFTKSWAAQLVTDVEGTVLEASWLDAEDHPDFAWLPWSDVDAAGPPENPYLHWPELAGLLGVD